MSDNMLYKIIYHKKAIKHIPLLKAAKLDMRVQKLLEVLRRDPFAQPPTYEVLKGDLQGMYSRRINVQHRLVYQVDETTHTVRVLSMWSHYDF